MTRGLGSILWWWKVWTLSDDDDSSTRRRMTMKAAAEGDWRVAHVLTKAKSFSLRFFSFYSFMFYPLLFFVLFGPSFSFFGDKLMMDHVLGINVEKISIIKKEIENEHREEVRREGGIYEGSKGTTQPTHPSKQKIKNWKKKERGYMRATVHKNSRSSTYQPPYYCICVLFFRYVIWNMWVMQSCRAFYLCVCLHGETRWNPMNSFCVLVFFLYSIPFLVLYVSTRPHVILFFSSCCWFVDVLISLLFFSFFPLFVILNLFVDH